MKTSPAGKMCVIAAFMILSYSGLRAANVEILDQELNPVGQGHTVLRVWGSYYEMGYGHASVLGDSVVEAVDQTKGELEHNYSVMRNRIAASIWLPVESESELDGMVDCLNATHPAAGIDKLDLKVLNTLGDWLYACRSHTCWGRYVAAPVKTLSTRRLDFSTALPILNHHVVIAYDPNDGSPEWLNLAWPGIVMVAQGINEYGTLVSLHDYQSFPADLSVGCISRLVAARYAVTYITSEDISTHLEHVFAELQNYDIMTGGFINYYAPLGFGGVINCSPDAAGPDFYRFRTPQAAWHHGEAMVTTNRDTTGTYTPSDEDFGVDAYYNDESPKTQESHWHLVDPVAANHGLSRLSVAYRGRRDMTVWADGRLDGIGRTPRLEYEWSDLFDAHAKYSGGNGTSDDPYQIATATDLMLLGENPDDYDKHFILTADIDLAPNLPGGKVFVKAIIAPDANDASRWFEGSSFSGVFDGSGHTISHMKIAGGNYLGLFGQLGSEAGIANLGLEALDVNGIGRFVGGLAGSNEGIITTSYNTGTVIGDLHVGGLVGENSGIITTSYSTSEVVGTGYAMEWTGVGDLGDVGGLVGRNGGTITTSYSTGTVKGDHYVGGLIGRNAGRVANSYSFCSVSGENGVGGFVGSNGYYFEDEGKFFGPSWGEGKITDCYSAGSASGGLSVGGFVGINLINHSVNSEVVNSFWDIETSGIASSDGGIGKTTLEMQTASTFLDMGWDFADETENGIFDYWWTSPSDYPRLRYHIGASPVMPEGLGTSAEPYLIRDARDLSTVWFKPLASYRLVESLDLSGITWSEAVVTWFGGTFDGNGHIISNLRIQGSEYLGLFGQLGPRAKVSDLGLEEVDVNGTTYVGGLVGSNSGSITGSYSTGSVNSIHTPRWFESYLGGVGGLVGTNYGSVDTSFSTATVSGEMAVGGLVGSNKSNIATIATSYSTGTVTGNKNVGGLVGNNSGNITRSYNTGTVIGDLYVGGLVGVKGGAKV